jgi:LPS-assembly protein
MLEPRALSRSPTSSGGEPRPTGGRGWVFARLLFLVLLASSLFAPVAAHSEKAASPEPRMVVEARELVYDETKNTVSARGNVQIYYKGRLLEADRVTYDRASGRIRAEGNARLTEPDGAVERAASFDLTDDFKNGFIQSLEADTANNTHFGAPHAERRGDANGQATIFDYGTYTACDACKDDPSKPRLWQIHAKRIIHDGVEKMIYYEDASLEFLDIPVAYMPYWSSPDPTVKRKSGLLMPTTTYGSYVGYGFGIPIYWAISPDKDLTVTPTYFTKQGPLLKGEYRQRFETGSFVILAEGTKPNDRGAFPSPPYGASNLKYRGAVESRGEFYPNDYWKFGWDVTALSDRYFLQDYRQQNPLYGNLFFRERSSTVYLTGQGDRSYFDVRGYYFQGLAPNDLQSQLPTAHPITDYNRAFDVDPYKTMGIGGQITLDANFTSTSAQIADYESIQPRTLDLFNGLYTVCQIYSPVANRSLSNCLLRGIGGSYESGTVQASWKRRVIDPVGGVWTPFAFARFAGSYLDYNTTETAPVYNSLYQPIPNAAQGLFVNGADNAFRGQATPGVGVDWRYPLVARSAAGALVVEPIAQIIARPNQSSIPSLVNMDAQSLVFDDSNLFEWNKFSGYDRFETGTRVNYGGQATFTFNNGAYVNGLVGQSAQVAGQNPYASPDAANVGLSSGLDNHVSDIVGRLVVSPISPITFIAKARFDPSDFSARRLDGFASIKLDPLSFEAHYANYEAQQLIGFDKRRQGLALNAKYNLTKNYFVSGTVTFDMSRYLYNNLTPYPTLTTTYTGVNLQGAAPVFSVAAMGFGGGYQDECTTFLVNYTSNYQQQTNTGLPARNQTVMVSLQLRTLGSVSFNQALSSVTMNDGVRTQP